LRDAAERAKIELSTGPYARVMEEALARGVDLDQEVAREDLEHLLEKYLERTLREVDRALSEARVAGRDLSRVLLVGGSTRIPAITARLEAHLGLPAEHSLDADLCVALGAAVQGAIISGDVLDHIVVDVSAHSLGVKTADRVPGDSVLSLVHGEADHFSPILPRNTKIPTRRSEVYYTMVPDQEVVSVQVFQGEARRCSENTFIGKFMFDLEPAPVDSPVVMELGYDLDGIVHVVILQKGTDNRKEATLSARRDQPVGEVAAEVADNFILRKARDAEAGLDEGDMRKRLHAATAEYQAALAEDLETERVDALEDALLELLEEAEEAAEDARDGP
jgi:molecular chaperone DnaK